MLKNLIHNLIQESIKKNQKQGIFPDFAIPEIKIDYHGDRALGDYASGIALNITKILGQDPMKIALAIESKIKKTNALEKIEIKSPGFINFFVSKKLVLKEVSLALKNKDKYGSSSLWKEKKIILEFTDPNPFKELHIGHLYSNIVGEAISKLFETVGAKVKRANYQGDVGLHVAKAVWGMQKKMSENKMDLAQLGKKSLDERTKFLGQSYVLGAKAFDEDEIAKEEMRDLNKKVFALDKSVKNIYQKGRQWSLMSFEKTYKRIGAKFDYYYFESKVAPIGVELVNEGFKKSVFQKSEGAIIFPGEKYGLHNRVFINSHGLPTYETKELGLAKIKYKDFKYDLSVIITGSEIIEYFKVLIVAIKELLPDLGKKTTHLPHGMVRLSEGKMASRKGNIVTAEQLLDQVKDLAVNNNRSFADFSEKDRDVIAEIVAIGAVKYAWLKNRIGQDIVFDYGKSLNIKGDSGPYLQYACVRCNSVLKKAKVRVANLKLPSKHDNLTEEELKVARTISRFPEVVMEAAEKFSPNLICGFAFNLAQEYNNLYDRHPILKAANKDLKTIRLLLTAATAQVLQNALYLLGIEVPEKM